MFRHQGVWEMVNYFSTVSREKHFDVQSDFTREHFSCSKLIRVRTRYTIWSLFSVMHMRLVKCVHLNVSAGICKDAFSSLQ